MKDKFSNLLLASLCLITLVLGCVPTSTTVSGTLDKDRIKSMHRIAVVSVIGDNFIVINEGASAAQYTEKEYAVNEWSIDNYVRDLVIQEIRKIKEYEYVDMKNDPQGMHRIYSSSKKTPYFSLLKRVANEELQRYADANAVDTIILIARSKSEDKLLERREIYGYGLLKKELPGSVKTRLFVVGIIVAIDAKTMDTIVYRPIFLEKDIDNMYSEKSFALLSSAENGFLRDEVKDTLRVKVPQEMGRMGMIPCLPGDDLCKQ